MSEAVAVDVCGFKVCTFPKWVYEIGETFYPAFMVLVVVGSALLPTKPGAATSMRTPQVLEHLSTG